jgi:hypothetical protein
MHSTFKTIVSSIHTATTGYFSPQNKAQVRHPGDSVSPQSNKMAPDTAARKGLFKDVVYFDSCYTLKDKHRNVLAAGGAVEYVPAEGDIDWTGITHVFTSDVDFPGRQEALKQPALAIMTVQSLMERN